MKTDYVLNRLLKARNNASGEVADAWVRLGRPVASGRSDPASDVDTHVDVLIESIAFAQCVDRATGGDDVSATLAALVVARGHLRALEREGVTVWWLEPGDLDDENFWGFSVKFVATPET